MAMLLRLGIRQFPRVFRNCVVSRCPGYCPVAFISTSKDKKDSGALAEKVAVHQSTENLLEKEENWMSYGYSLTDREEDEFGYHFILFTGIFVLVWATVYFAYYPDFKLNNWSQREAYLELARRERDGLPLIDPNYIDVAKVKLPSDEELGPDFEIII